MPAVKITQKPIGIPGDDTHFLVTQPELPEGYTPTGQETEEELAELKVESVREIEMDDMVELIQDKLDMDVTPTTGSSKPVTSGGIKAVIDEVVAAVEQADLKAEDARTAMAIFLQAWRIMKEEVDTHLTEHDEEFSAETGVVVLHNTNTAHMLFNDSGQTIALEKVRNTMNYDLDTDVIDVSGGQLADIIVYDKQLNGFKMKFEGSAKTVSVKYKVRGGMYA